MITVTKEGILLEKSQHGFENEGVLNPAVIKENDIVHVLYRAVTKGNYSTIGYCSLDGPLKIKYRSDVPILFPQFEYEKNGTEDPRIVKIEDTYYLSYTAFDGTNALGALALSKDLKVFDKKGIIVPQVTYDEFNHLANAKGTLNEKYVRYNAYGISHEKHDKPIYVWDKNLVLFPRKINNKLYFLHRIKPDIQIVVGVTDLSELTDEFWQNYFLNLDKFIVLSPKYPHETSYIGSGCPPIETPLGWLLIYHGVHDTLKGYVYSACAALLDINNPAKEIARLPYPLFYPEKSWELKGEVNNVCFPSGTACFDDKLYIYYGAADERIAVASLSLSELLKELELNTKR